MIRLSKRSHAGEHFKLNIWSPYIAPLSWGARFSLGVLVNPFLFRKFLKLLVLALSKMAHADGQPSQRELYLLLELFDREFRLSRRRRDKAISLFFTSDSPSLEECLQELMIVTGRSLSVRRCLLNVLLAMAYEDNVITASEEALILAAGGALELSPIDLERIRSLYHRKTTVTKKKEESRQSRHTTQTRKDTTSSYTYSSTWDTHSTSSEEKPPHREPSPQFVKGTWYEILGCSPEDSVREIKRRYRELLYTYHPDHLPQSIPKEVRKDAAEKFLQVQRAYEEFERIQPS